LQRAVNVGAGGRRHRLIAFADGVAGAREAIALLVGNQAYANETGRLANPHNDVALLETALGCPEPGRRLPAQWSNADKRYSSIKADCAGAFNDA
jgi:hypothetical protein